MSGASERANGRASGPVLTSLFLFIPDHSAPSEGESDQVSIPLQQMNSSMGPRTSDTGISIVSEFRAEFVPSEATTADVNVDNLAKEGL